MNIIIALLFLCLVSECIALLFYGKDTKDCQLVAVVLFLISSTVLLQNNNLSFSEEINIKQGLLFECLKGLTPILAAALVFTMFQAFLSKNVSPNVAKVTEIFRPICLAGFVIITIRKLPPIALALVMQGADK